MHLTPRQLGLAVAATLAGCTVLGVMTSLDLAGAVSADTPTSSSAAPSPVEPAAPIVPTPASSPAAPPTPTPAALPTPSPSPSPSIVSTPTLAPVPSPSMTATPTVKASPPAKPLTARASGRTSAPIPPRRPVAPRRTTALGAWRAPVLRVGSNTITRPRLTSGAPVSVTVACSPSVGCSMSGAHLQVQAGTSVTVTWTAPSRSGYTRWTVSRVL